MNVDEINRAVKGLKPGTQFNVRGSVVEMIDGSPAPTPEQMQAWLAANPVTEPAPASELDELRAAVARQQQFIDALAKEAAKKLSG